jgi:hypothetical protein
VGGEVKADTRHLLRLIRVLERLEQRQAQLQFATSGNGKRRWLLIELDGGQMRRRVEITRDTPVTLALMVVACDLGLV